MDEVAALAKTDLPAREFYAALLDRTVRSLAAAGGAVWLRRPNGLIVEYQVGLGQTRFADGSGAADSHLRWVESVSQASEVQVLPPNSGSSREAASANTSEFLLLAGPLKTDDEPFGVIEIFQRSGCSPAAQRGYVQLLGVLCETAADFERHRQLLELRKLESLWNQFDRFADVAHGNLDLDTTAYTIANEGRRLIECGRLSVAVSRGRRPRLAAVSGLDDFDRRSNVVRLLEHLSTAVLSIREPLWYRGESTHLSPQIETALEEYVEESHVRMLAIVPLIPAEHEHAAPRPESLRHESLRPVGALIVESFEAPADEDALRQRVGIVARHATNALRNALTYRNIPFSPVFLALGRMSWFVRLRQLPFTVLALIVIAAVAAGLALIPGDFSVEGRGELRPEVKRDIFAPNDGIVDELHVQHGDAIDKHDSEKPNSGLLLRLRNLELEFEQSRITGEKQTAETELAAVQAARLGAKPDSPESREQYNQLTAKEEELKEHLKSLNTQLAVLRSQQAALSVHSPIAGEVLTWNVSQSLETRPVKRGQILLTVAQTDGPWVLEMHVPDNHIGYVLDAQRDLQPELGVSFILKTDPGKTYRGKVVSVARSTDADSANAGTVLVTVAFDRSEIQGLRPGATVVAQIDCGRRPIGYVWFHDLIETIRTKILF